MQFASERVVESPNLAGPLFLLPVESIDFMEGI